MKKTITSLVWFENTSAKLTPTLPPNTYAEHFRKTSAKTAKPKPDTWNQNFRHPMRISQSTPLTRYPRVDMVCGLSNVCCENVWVLVGLLEKWFRCQKGCVKQLNGFSKVFMRAPILEGSFVTNFYDVVWFVGAGFACLRCLIWNSLRFKCCFWLRVFKILEAMFVKRKGSRFGLGFWWKALRFSEVFDWNNLWF